MTGEASANQDSLRMREVSDLTGHWTVNAEKTKCVLIFTGDRLESANAWKLSDVGGCLAEIAPGAVGWRPAPDGIELVAGDRRTILMFDGNGEARGASGQALRLVRARD